MTRRIAAVVLLAAGAIAIGWALVFHQRPSLPDLAGDWQSWRSTLRISHDGDGYAIVVDNPTGFLGGVYAGKPRDGGVTLEGPLAELCREMRYVKDGDKLQFCGEEFERMKGSAARASIASNMSRPAASAREKPTGSTAVVAKATCGPGSHPETALQGQVPPPLRRVGQFA